MIAGNALELLSKEQKELFDRGIAYLRDMDPQTVECGTYQIEGQNLFVNVFETQTRSEAPWEAHRQYADIHFLLCGEEKIGVAPIETFLAAEPYDEAHDIVFGTTACGDYLTMRSGEYLILMPDMAHAPAVAPGSPMMIKKCVMKVKMK